jgi:hypothetical protein
MRTLRAVAAPAAQRRVEMPATSPSMEAPAYTSRCTMRADQCAA